MGERGPQPMVLDRPVKDKDYSRLVVLLLTDRQQEAYDWLKSYTPKERGEMLDFLKQLWDEQQVRILDTALEVMK
jgi:hypothetical protein